MYAKVRSGPDSRKLELKPCKETLPEIYMSEQNSELVNKL